MSYDVLVSKLSDDKLGTFGVPPVEERGIEDEMKLQRPASGPEATTPSRKISANRFMSAFTQFYGNNEESDQQQLHAHPSSGSSSSTSRTPTRGMETRLMSMWNNMRYGLSGKMRSTFSKEQPVWLLGRCYHRKCTPPSSMESSAELSVSLENKLIINDSEPHLFDDNSIQEYGMDAIEGKIFQLW